MKNQNRKRVFQKALAERQARLNVLREQMRTTPYVLTVVTTPDLVIELANAVGRSPDRYLILDRRMSLSVADLEEARDFICRYHIGEEDDATFRAAFYIPEWEQCLDALRRVQKHIDESDQPDQWWVVGDLRVQLALPPIEPDIERILRVVHAQTTEGPFVVATEATQERFDATSIVGRVPDAVVGDVAIFEFGGVYEAIEACTRLALADGTYDSSATDGIRSLVGEKLH